MNNRTVDVLRKAGIPPSPQPSPWEGEGATPALPPFQEQGPSSVSSPFQGPGARPAPSPFQGEGWGEGGIWALPAAPGRWRWPAALQASVGLHAAAGLAAVALPGAAPWALAAVVANHALLTAAGLWPRSALLGPNVTRLPAAAAATGAVALTIDDGPDPEVTPAVLDLLAAHGARATFFCIGQRVREQPALVRRIVAAGHSVQNHSLHHRHDFSLRGPAALAREIGDAQAALADTTGRLPHCFRAPAGLRNPLLDPVLHRLGLHLVSWTRRGFDTREADASRVAARLQRGLAAGDILLLHDGHARRTASGQPVLLQVLPPLLQRLAQMGLHAATLQDTLPLRHAPQAVAPVQA